MVAGICEREEKLSPAVGEFGKAVEEQDERTVRIETGLENVEGETVDVFDETRSNAGWKSGLAVCDVVVHLGSQNALRFCR